MNKNKTNTWGAYAILLGTIVGAGIFGIPYIFAQSGYLIGIVHLVVLGTIMIIMHKMYAEVVLRTPTEHQLPGYVELYLGRRAKKIATFSLAFGLLGSLIAYLLQIGNFLQNAFSTILPAPAIGFTLLFFLLAWIAIIAGINIRTRAQLIMVGILILMIVGLLIVGLPEIQTTNLTTVQPSKFLLPYGVVLFSFAGFSAIVDLIKILKEKNQEQKAGKVITSALLTALIVGAIMGLTFVGIFGTSASADPVADLGALFGAPALILGGIFGTLVIATSFITVSATVLHSLQHDYKLKYITAAAIAALIPLIVTLSGLTNFINTILIVGAVSGGIDAILLIATYYRARKETSHQKPPVYTSHTPKWLSVALIAVFIIGMIYEIWAVSS